ncbi:DNA internalization-related competence protein ComEC/Rec2 [Undibacterium cyanobacteriorum]|uniref:DNA internalization-related competence protein ComEC/Rec2 n=1 Tax=Undibacterium cyanobacteriorum TaxID=3073561 RepID=A0ABY9RGA7_9BURK|nr:DNA internalization-related competence protein ComEC/Rec2 [Undibacterium sp. 20NA77.5]WMW79272.1 DNA internalization-related competence protein ComEC/Rec2 [Undibacterium sp. 20NA77.5]
MRTFILAFGLGVYVLQQQARLWAWQWYCGALLFLVLYGLWWLFSLHSRKAKALASRLPSIVEQEAECTQNFLLSNESHRHLLMGVVLAIKKITLGFLLGFAWAGGFASMRLEHRLPEKLLGRDLQVVGVIHSLPTRSAQGWHFQFEIETVGGHDAAQKIPNGPKRIAVSWFVSPSNPRDFSELKAGQRWRLMLRMKPIYGNANPYAFDYEAWMLEQGLEASATVRSESASKLADGSNLSPVPITDSAVSRREQTQFDSHPNQKIQDFVFSLNNLVERTRSLLRDRLQAHLHHGVDRPFLGVITALVIGDQSGISQSQWAVFNRSGIGHLVSISGLHITMIAGLFAGLFSFFWRRSFYVGRDWPLVLPVPKVRVLVAAVVALLYVALAGFGVPAQRTLWMMIVVAVAVWSGRRARPSYILCLALFVVLLIDPWAVLAPGFWLSFCAVALLLYAAGRTSDMSEAVSPLQRSSSESSSSERPSILRRLGSNLIEAGRAQYVVTIGLVPLTLLLFSQISLISPLANAIAIPVISFIVTPLALLGSVLPTTAAQVVLDLAHLCMTGLFQLLEVFNQFPVASWSVPQPKLWMFLLAGLGIICLLAPRGWPLRLCGIVYCLPMLTHDVSHPNEGQFQITAFDVGQGSALFIETSQHRLIYDTGPGSSDESNSGLRILLPYLNGRGIRAVDDVVISHADADHSGGAVSTLRALSVQRIRSSLPADSEILADTSLPSTKRPQHLRCEAGQSWEWDGVHFEFLHPVPVIYTSDKWKTNARSCTLKVSNGKSSMLLTGDIGVVQEDELLNSIPEKLKADVLLVPHHGSGSSSSFAFIQAVQPRYALFQFGYLNRYHHPHPSVWQRYLDFGVIPLSTVTSGAITLQFGDTIEIDHFRQQHQRYWYPQTAAVDTRVNSTVAQIPP